MRIVLLSALCIGTTAASAVALPPAQTPLQALSITANTGEKPQSKTWIHDGKWWCVLPNSSGTWVWRLDGDTWTSNLKLSNATTTNADVKTEGDVTHVLLYLGTSSQLASIEYVPASQSYQFWTVRPGNVPLTLDNGVETATIDVDSQGRMWLASDEVDEIRVRFSDPPYSTWSGPISLVTGISSDDISVLAALPDGRMGVLWSNQNTRRFGFRSHVDGSDATFWTADEVPASQSALPVGLGMSDDHLNIAVASDGTLYAAVKTSYDTTGYPKIALLVRRPSGTWDDLYEVDGSGTRGIVLLNEGTATVTVVYTSDEGSGNILYKESSTASIAFAPTRNTLIPGSLNDVTSTKQNINGAIVILASSTSGPLTAVGVLMTSCHAPCAVGVNAAGSRHLVVTPPAGFASVALRVSSAGLSCLPKYVDATGRLAALPVFQSSTQWGTVHVGDRTIVPATAYTVTAELVGGSAVGSGSATTGGWGNADGQGDVNVFDIICVMDGSQSIFTRCSLDSDDQKAGVPDGLIDLDDILATLDAFSGAAYPDADPCVGAGVQGK